MTAPQSTSQAHYDDIRQALIDIQFVKITGPTGDWIVLSEPTKPLAFTPEHIAWLCNRSSGVGAIGVVLITAASRPTQYPVFDLEAWKADGTPVTDLTEAARAATYTLAALHRTPDSETSHHVFNSATGIITTVYTPTYVGVDIGQWSYAAPDTATAAGSDTLVMAAGLTDPRPGLSIRTQSLHITIAVESFDELESIDLTQSPSVEPPVTEPTGVNFVVPQDPLMIEGMGQLALRHHPADPGTLELGSAAAAATIAFQLWAGLTQPHIWNVSTLHGDIVVQLHEDRRVSTFAALSTVFFGRL